MPIEKLQLWLVPFWIGIATALCAPAKGQSRDNVQELTQREYYSRSGVIATRRALDYAIDGQQGSTNNDFFVGPGQNNDFVGRDPSFTAPNYRREFDSDASGVIELRSHAARLIAQILPVLSRLPTLKIEVQPSPPRDYWVEINGEVYPATEQGLYGIPPGNVVVRVFRPGRPPCVWSGSVKDDLPLNCNFAH